jgi:DNA-binding XRE family transcriptional regulator
VFLESKNSRCCDFDTLLAGSGCSTAAIRRASSQKPVDGAAEHLGFMDRGSSADCKQGPNPPLPNFQWATKLRKVQMDAGTFKNWRKQLCYTQEEAARHLGVVRSTIQHWEHEVTALPGAIDFACDECVCQWKQRPDLGPVLLVYTCESICRPSDGPPLLHCEPHPDNDAAIQRLVHLRKEQSLANAWIFEEGNNVIWNGPELLRECGTRSTLLGMAHPSTEPMVMDSWGLKKWRKTFGYDQFEAAERLGVRRASIQHWEQEHRSIPRVVELACQQMIRRRKQLPEFGPVLLAYADGSIWQPSQEPYYVSLLRSELCASNEIAMQHVDRLKNDPYFSNPFVTENNGEIIWTTSELLRERHNEKTTM